MDSSSSDRRWFQMNRYYFLSLLAAILAIPGSGCGGGGPKPMAKTLSAAQAQAVSHQVVQTLTTALGNSLTGIVPQANGTRPSLSRVIGEAHSNISGCTSTPTGQNCNVPVSFTGPCSAGGTITLGGNVDGTLDNSGTGSLSTQITVTPTNCGLAGTTINGDPNIMFAGQIGLANGSVVFPVNFMESGGISFGPNPSGTCQVNVQYSLSSSSCTATGTICGQSVNGSC